MPSRTDEAQRKAEGVAASAREYAIGAKEQAKDTATELKHKARGAGSYAREHYYAASEDVKEKATELKHKAEGAGAYAREHAINAEERAKESATELKHKAEGAGAYAREHAISAKEEALDQAGKVKAKAAAAGTAAKDTAVEALDSVERNINADAGDAQTSAIKSFLSGGFGGVCAVLVGHPFDLTKVRLQTAKKGEYSGTLDVVKKAIAKDGVRGLYRGMLPPLVGITPIFAVSFWGYDMGKRIVYAATPKRTDPKLSLGELAFAGFFSAVPTTLLAAPMERVKVLLQIQGQSGEAKYKGPGDAVRQLYREGGLRSIFRGTFATLGRDGPGSAAYFVTYEVVKKKLTPVGGNPGDLNFGAVLVAGGTAGMAMWSIAIPPDVIKSRLQSAPQGTYTGFMDCARQMIAADGPSALFKGFGPAMLRAFPANAATFMGVEASLWAMNKLW